MPKSLRKTGVIFFTECTAVRGREAERVYRAEGREEGEGRRKEREREEGTYPQAISNHTTSDGCILGKPRYSNYLLPSQVTGRKAEGTRGSGSWSCYLIH